MCICEHLNYSELYDFLPNLKQLNYFQVDFDCLWYLCVYEWRHLIQQLSSTKPRRLKNLLTNWRRSKLAIHSWRMQPSNSQLSKPIALLKYLHTNSLDTWLATVHLHNTASWRCILLTVPTAQFLYFREPEVLVNLLLKTFISLVLYDSHVFTLNWLSFSFVVLVIPCFVWSKWCWCNW